MDVFILSKDKRKLRDAGMCSSIWDTLMLCRGFRS